MSVLKAITAKLDAETAGMSPDERFHFYRQRDLNEATKLGLTLQQYRNR